MGLSRGNRTYRTYRTYRTRLRLKTSPRQARLSGWEKIADGDAETSQAFWVGENCGDSAKASLSVAVWISRDIAEI